MTMKKPTTKTPLKCVWHVAAKRRLLLASLTAVSALPALWLAGCAVEFQNLQPAREVALMSKPPGSVYAGWRVFQDRCAGCHGPAANGGTGGPDLLLKVSTMGPRQFVGLVISRYDWSQAAVQAGSPGVEREAVTDAVLQRKQGMLTMPAWQGEPRVSAHIVDLYAYVSARAQGTQGPDRPAP
jgi:mono/diheme cytochrome c family protein